MDCQPCVLSLRCSHRWLTATLTNLFRMRNMLVCVVVVYVAAMSHVRYCGCMVDPASDRLRLKCKVRSPDQMMTTSNISKPHCTRL